MCARSGFDAVVIFARSIGARRHASTFLPGWGPFSLPLLGAATVCNCFLAFATSLTATLIPRCPTGKGSAL
eukprot:15437006-Alexandrium_andersonii.AAC.1